MTLEETIEYNNKKLQKDVDNLADEVNRCNSIAAFASQNIVRMIARTLRYEVLTMPQAKILYKQINDQTLKFAEKCSCTKNI